VTLPDWAGWSGLAVADARSALESVSDEFGREDIGGTMHWMPRDVSTVKEVPLQLLPGFDEYLMGYKDRSAILDAAQVQKVMPGTNGMVSATIVREGRLIGTWKRVLKRKAVVVSATPFAAFKKRDREAFAEAAGRYGAFVGLPVEVAI
jgi:hypothetical protein